MKREEQIRSAAFEASTRNDDYKKYAKDGIARMFFVEGAMFADANQPNPWISVEERLPDEGTAIFEAYTLVVTCNDLREEKECVVVSRYNRGFVGEGVVRKHPMNATSCSTTHHWMPIPELPKEE
jgi:hypothetical protein